MAGLFDRFVRRFSNETSLFRTHQPEFQDPGRAVGSLVDHEGALYVVTRWVELPRVPLNRGGSVREWEVFGRPADPAEVDALIGEAAELLLAGEPTGGANADASEGEA
ncbi:MAG: hypothetical protein ACYC33_00885 [Thermoleophilia bacterium]